MGLGWRRSRARNSGELIGFGAVRETRGLGRKRVGISKVVKEEDEIETSSSCCCFGDEVRSPLKRQCSEKLQLVSGGSYLESLPQELLIRVLCGVEHDDLKQLVVVSKSVMEAALLAKILHFAYSTPPKVKAFKNKVDIADLTEPDEELEAPGAPKKSRNCRRKISLMTEDVLSSSLFHSEYNICADEG